jgi:hypothetical protein
MFTQYFIVTEWNVLCLETQSDFYLILLIGTGGNNFHFSMSSRPALGPTQPPIQRVPGAPFPGVKRPGREADHSPPTSAEVKKMWIYTSTPSYAFMA